MSHAKNSTKAVIYSKTKKIRKQKQSSASIYQKDLTLKKYTTFTKSQKLSIITDIRKILWPNATKKSSPLNDIVNCLENLNKNRYNKILEHILSVYSPSSLKWKGNKKEWQKYLKQWRRQIKTWIKNIDKPETRGSVRVVPHEKTAEFKQRMIEILQSLPSRNFDLLREKALEALKNTLQFNDDFYSHHLMNENIFSKHFWYDFKRANPDIAELYSKLPICRYNARKKKGAKEIIDENSEEGNETASSVSGVLSASPFHKSDQPLLSDNVSTVGGSCSPMNGDQSPNVMDSDEQNQGNSWSVFLNFDFEDTSMFIEKERELEVVGMRVNDYAAACNVPVEKCEKMIIESEDNPIQRDFFREFFENGINA